MTRQKADIAVIDQRIKQATQTIVDSYSSPDFVIQHINRRLLPSREAIIDIITTVQELIFPGYFGLSGLDETNIGTRTQTLVEDLYEQLSEQITRSLVLDDVTIIEDVNELPRQAENRALAFIEAIPELRNALSQDVQAAYDGDPAARSYDEIIFSYPGVFAVMVYRIAHCLCQLDVPLIPRVMTEYAHSKTGIDIHPGAEIGNSFFIDHGTGVVIGETTVIGNNVKIYQGVTLGALSLPKNKRGELLRGVKRHPTLEDNVIIYSGATILGGNTVVGEGSIIGGNVWLTHSVPPRTKVTIEEPQFRIKQSPVANQYE